MNSEILNSILNGELKPWLISFDDERILKDIIKQVKNNPNETSLQVQSNLNALLKPFPALLKGLNFTPLEQLQPISFSSNLPAPVTLFNHYYKGIIDAEVARYFNATIHNPLIKDKALDVPFQIGHQSLKGIAGLCNQINNEIVERDFESNNTAITDTAFFTLTYLRNSLLALYFAIQKPFEEHLKTTYNSYEDYALYCLDEANFEFSLIPNENVQQAIQPISKPKLTEPPKFSFCWKGGSIDNLQALFDDLCVDIKFLDEEKTSVKTLVELLTSRNIDAGTPHIYLGCRTTEFVIVMDAIGKHFQRLTQTTIEQSKCFWSKPATNKPSTLISSTTISKSRAKNKTKEEVISDKKATIDKHLP
jgi:hypothetical protein